MAWGQDQPDQQEEGPGRGVARVSVMDGDVSVQRGDSGETVAAALNAPLVVEDQLMTGPNSRAEIQFDWANMVRLASLSEVRLAELENQRYQIQVARGTASDPEFQVVRAVAQDDWDRWNENRDRQLDESASYDHVSPDIYGAEDLDNYGSWQTDPSYGDVWCPRVAEDWVPYRDGRWSWMDWYGWNWVSCDPWGWAPYHYGRWFNTPGRGWGW